MLPISLGIMFGLELVACAVACALVWQWRVAEAPVGPIIVLVALSLVGVRVLIHVGQFIWSHFRRSPRPPESRIGFGAAVRMVTVEILSCWLIWMLLVPLARRLVTPRRGNVMLGKRLPILFIHGFSSNAGIWAPLIHYLSGRGVTNVFTMKLHPLGGDLDDMAQQVAARVNRICSMTRAKRVILVAHSMGGLVARAYAERAGGAERVAKIICIGTPHHGTLLARIAPGPSGKQMRIDSAWLHAINRDENQPFDTEYVSIFSVHDNAVVPQASAELGKAKNAELAGMGHFAMLFSKKVGQLVYREVTSA